MGKLRFVQAGTVRKELADGEDWIEIKERLSYGEQQRLAGGALGKASGMLTGNIEVPFDFEQYEILRMFLWITDWSFTNERGKEVKVTRAALANLDPDVAEEISAIIVAHIEEREAQKKVTDGESESSST